MSVRYATDDYYVFSKGNLDRTRQVAGQISIITDAKLKYACSHYLGIAQGVWKDDSDNAGEFGFGLPFRPADEWEKKLLEPFKGEPIDATLANLEKALELTDDADEIEERAVIQEAREIITHTKRHLNAILTTC